MLKKNKLQVIIIFLILIISSGICIAEEILLRDSWYLLEKDGKPVGFNFGQIFQVDDGYRYEYDQTIQMNFLGNPVEVTQHIEWKVDQEFKLQLLEISTKTDEVMTKTVTTCNNGEINVVTTDATGKEYKSYWQIDEELYLTDSFLDYLFIKGDVQVGQEYVVTCWNVAQNKPEAVTIRIEEAITDEYKGKAFSGFKIRMTAESGESITFADSSGDLIKLEDLQQNFTQRKVEKEEIPQLESMAMDVLMVPGNINVAHPFRSTDSQIRVKWNKVDNEQFNWEDNRQKLIEYQKTDQGQEVLLTIKKDMRDFAGVVNLPVTEEKFIPYLKETDFINPSLPEVQELVTEIIGDEDDGWIVTQKLVNWVYEFIKYEPVIQTLTTEEILERKGGKCVEYAVLFASLARSAGLPTRVIFGERYEANNWIGHLWNEVWLGEWITVDPSHNQISPDALLLKFVDSDNVMGTQIVRRGLIGQLDIEIIDVQLAATETEEREVLETGINGQTYTNADFQCRITGPEGWQLIETSEQGVPLLVMQSANVGAAQGVLIMFSIPNGTTSEQMLQTRITALKNVLPEFTMIDQQNAVIANEPAAYGTWTFNFQGNLVRQQNWVLAHGDLCYILVFGVADEMWDDYQNYFQEILANFETID